MTNKLEIYIEREQRAVDDLQRTIERKQRTLDIARCIRTNSERLRQLDDPAASAALRTKYNNARLENTAYRSDDFMEDHFPSDPVAQRLTDYVWIVYAADKGTSTCDGVYKGRFFASLQNISDQTRKDLVHKLITIDRDMTQKMRNRQITESEYNSILNTDENTYLGNLRQAIEPTNPVESTEPAFNQRETIYTRLRKCWGTLTGKAG